MQHRRNTGTIPILPMITLLHEFLIVLCVLCVPKVDSSLYQIKHCLSLVLYRKYSTQRVVLRRNIALGFASCYICLSPTLFVLYFPYSTHGSVLSSTYILYIHINHYPAGLHSDLARAKSPAGLHCKCSTSGSFDLRCESYA